MMMMMMMMAFCKSSPNTNVSLQMPTRLARILKCGHLDCTPYRICSFSAHKRTSQPHQAIHGSFFIMQHWTERPSYGSTLILMPESRHCPKRTRIMTCGPCFNVSLRFPKKVFTRRVHPPSDRLFAAPPAPAMGMDDQIQLSPIFEGVRVGDVLDPTNGRYCYRYD